MPAGLLVALLLVAPSLGLLSSNLGQFTNTPTARASPIQCKVLASKYGLDKVETVIRAYVLQHQTSYYSRACLPVTAFRFLGKTLITCGCEVALTFLPVAKAHQNTFGFQEQGEQSRLFSVGTLLLCLSGSSLRNSHFLHANCACVIYKASPFSRPKEHKNVHCDDDTPFKVVNNATHIAGQPKVTT